MQVRSSTPVVLVNWWPVRLPTGMFVVLLRDGRSQLLHPDGKPARPHGQWFFTGHHGLSANLGGMGVMRSGQLIVADSNARRLVLFDKDGKFLSHHPIAQGDLVACMRSNIC
jgi:hypothetical protein